MKTACLSLLGLLCAATRSDAASVSQGSVIVPGGTNAVQFRLYTNASPKAARLFNTFEIEAYGETLLQSPGEDRVSRWPAASASNTLPHNVLIDGLGPELAPTNGMSVVEQAAGPEWRYVGLDVTAAFRHRLEHYRRGILFIEPDLFVVYDQIVAREPVAFQMLLHPPAAARVDEDWRDLRLELPRASLRVNAPGAKGRPRSWECIGSPADPLLPGTVTMRMGPTNRLARIDLITVFAVHRTGGKKDYAFKLLEGNAAVGARIYREGLPTLVAFRLDPAIATNSLIGFGFSGPVGVDVYSPRQRRPQQIPQAPGRNRAP